MERLTADAPESRSLDVAAANLEKLRALFPEIVTEGREGVAINVDVLKQLVGDRTLTDADEKYGLNWHGKRQARQLALTPSTGTLRPCKDDSVAWETTQNLFLEGDNLEVLKLLQKSYAGKVRLIYIDPPYNTGNDFVYPDDFRDNIRNYLERTGQLEDGRRVSSNSEASGSFHTAWLNMMEPRLRLARDLLREDGVVFVAIDDHELHDLRHLLDSVFGPENFIDTLVWEKKVSPSNDSQYFSNDHEYIVVYSRQKQPGIISRLQRTAEHNKYYTNPDKDPRGAWNSVAATCNKNAEERPNLYYPIKNPHTQAEIWPRREAVWAFSRERMSGLMQENLIYWGSDGNSSSPRVKNFLSEAGPVVPRSVLHYRDAGHTQAATSELRVIMPDAKFDYPKPVSLLRHIIQLVSVGDGADNWIALDFFAGSGTTGHAIYEANAADGGTRRFLNVQLPQRTDSTPFRTIAEITKERLRRAGAKVRKDNPLFHGDVGFRVYKLDSTNLRVWDPDTKDVQAALFDSIEHVKPGRTEADLLTEVLLKLGLDLCVPIETRTIAGHEVHAVGGGKLIACLTPSITRASAEKLGLGMAGWLEELLPQALGKRGEVTALFRDSAFDGDVTKTNLSKILDQQGFSRVRSL